MRVCANDRSPFPATACCRRRRRPQQAQLEQPARLQQILSLVHRLHYRHYRRHRHCRRSFLQSAQRRRRRRERDVVVTAAATATAAAAVSPLRDMNALALPPTHFTAKFPSREFYPAPPLNVSLPLLAAPCVRVRCVCLCVCVSLRVCPALILFLDLYYTHRRVFCFFVIHKMLQNGVAPSIYLPITRPPRASPLALAPLAPRLTGRKVECACDRKEKKTFFLSLYCYICLVPRRSPPPPRLVLFHRRHHVTGHAERYAKYFACNETQLYSRVVRKLLVFG